MMTDTPGVGVDQDQPGKAGNFTSKGPKSTGPAYLVDQSTGTWVELIRFNSIAGEKPL